MVPRSNNAKRIVGTSIDVNKQSATETVQRMLAAAMSGANVRTSASSINTKFNQAITSNQVRSPSSTYMLSPRVARDNSRSLAGTTSPTNGQMIAPNSGGTLDASVLNLVSN